MGSPSDGSESARTLPRPELNPLLNPLLADNMGRWAEVYFTNPPEKREEAVIELLRELSTENPGRDLAPREPEPASESVGALGSKTQSVNPMRQFDNCGHDNPQNHQFCGMCGATLSNAVDESGHTYDGPQNGKEISSSPLHTETSGDRLATEAYAEQRGPLVQESRSDPYDLSLFQSFRELNSAGDVEYEEPSSPPYRYYVGALLGILLLVLGYIAWRASQGSQNGQEASALLPPVATEGGSAAANPGTTAAPKPAEPAPSPAVKKAAEPSTTKVAETEKRAEPDSSRKHAPVAAPTPATSPSVDSSEHSSQQGNGAEELAMAQRYLNGTYGRRDTAEAAKWLWKSIAKHNGPATVLLAELYLKGDGVSKNCDQARVLLDSAARRGMAGAGERLRNLQAFGCQ